MRFFLPFSSLLLCCCLSVLKNHFKTNNARFSGSGSLAGATKRLGRSAQYDENSIIDCEERRNGGAVREARSPLKVARDCAEISYVLDLLPSRENGVASRVELVRALMKEKNALFC
jgi:hypothetical protein